MEEEAVLSHKVADSVGHGFTLPAEKKIETSDVAPIALTMAFFFSEKGLEHVDSGRKTVLGEMA